MPERLNVVYGLPLTDKREKFVEFWTFTKQVTYHITSWYSLLSNTVCHSAVSRHITRKGCTLLMLMFMQSLNYGKIRILCFQGTLYSYSFIFVIEA